MGPKTGADPGDWYNYFHRDISLIGGKVDKRGATDKRILKDEPNHRAEIDISADTTISRWPVPSISTKRGSAAALS